MSLQSNFVHCIIAVSKNSPEIPQQSLVTFLDFLLDSIEAIGARQFAAGGSGNHVHFLISVPTDMALSVLMAEIKKITRRWLRDTAKNCHKFEWEQGYTTFSVGISQFRETVAYISRQLECHRKIDFDEELVLFSEAYKLAVSSGV